MSLEVTAQPDEAANASNGSLALATSMDVEAYIVEILGPRRLALNWLIPLTTVYSIIFLTGIVGNVCTCLVIARNQYMQTATNCYLFNLAIADMLTLLFAMPLELYTLWQQYPWELGGLMCLLRGVVPEATAYASILTIVTFSTERYIAICYPIRQQTKSKLSHAIRNIAVIWVVSVLAAIPFAVFTRVNHLYSGAQIIGESAWCGFPFTDPDRNWEILMLCSTFLFFVVPLSMITALYVRIALALHRSRHLHRSTSEGASYTADRERVKVQSRRVVIRMLVAVVIAFFVCWAPFHAQRLLFLYVSLYGEWTDTLKHINQNLFSLAGCFYYFNSTINPILYSVMSNRFRVAFREKLCAGPPSLWCICCCCFCCVKDFEKRSQRTPAIYRNSNSHSSVRSYVSYPPNLKHHHHHSHLHHSLSHSLDGHAVSLPRVRSMAVDYNEKLGVTLTWIRDMEQSSSPSSSRRTLRVVESSSSGRDEPSDFADELDKALRPQLEKLEEAEKSDCVNCTNCTLLFPAKSKGGYDAADRTSTTEVTQSEYTSDKMSPEMAESVV